MNKMNGAQKRNLGIESRSIHEDQGFYVYRSHRLINWGTWLRMSRKAQLTKLSRVRVDIPNTMDHLWELDIKKSMATPPKVVRDRLGVLLEDLQSRSSTIQGGSGSRVMTTGKRQDVWTTKLHEGKTFSVEVNRESEIYKHLIEGMTPESRTMLNAYLKLLGGRFQFVFTPKHASWLNLIEAFFSKMARVSLRGLRVNSKDELRSHIEHWLAECNADPVPFRWKWKMEEVHDLISSVI